MFLFTSLLLSSLLYSASCQRSWLSQLSELDSQEIADWYRGGASTQLGRWIMAAGRDRDRNRERDSDRDRDRDRGRERDRDGGSDNKSENKEKETPQKRRKTSRRVQKSSRQSKSELPESIGDSDNGAFYRVLESEDGEEDLVLIKNKDKGSEYLPEDIPLPEGPLYREIGSGDQKELVLIKNPRKTLRDLIIGPT